jgi:hypothetical protein
MLLVEDSSLSLSQFPLDFASAVNYCQITVDANEAYIKYRFKLEKKVTHKMKKKKILKKKLMERILWGVLRNEKKS